MSVHTTKFVALCFATLRQLRSSRRYLSQESFTRLFVTLLLSRLDYCNTVGCLPTSSAVCSSSSMPLLGRSTASVNVITWHHCCSISTGCLFPNMWSLNSVCWVYRCLHVLGPEICQVTSRRWL